MKIERISENQIRCTLNKADLAARQLKISELAYGSEKAKALFRDMMKQAAYEVGFESDDIPLMIEAIPISAECIVLIVTKVDDPEELDTRFSKFSPNNEEEDYGYDSPFEDFDSLDTMANYDEAYANNAPSARDELPDSQDPFLQSSIGNEIRDLFGKVQDFLNQATSDSSEHAADFIPLKDSIEHFPKKENPMVAPSAADTDISEPVVRIFSFDDFDTFTDAMRAIQAVYTGESALYKSPKNNLYYVILNKKDCPFIDFNKTCNILSEYGTKEHMNEASTGYFSEHCKCLIPHFAVQKGAKL